MENNWKKWLKVGAAVGVIASSDATAQAGQEKLPPDSTHTKHEITLTQKEQSEKDTTKFTWAEEGVVDTTVEGLVARYNKNKEVNDSNFNTVFNLTDSSMHRTIYLEYKANQLHSIKVITTGQNGNSIREKFASLSEFIAQHPLYNEEVQKAYNESYKSYIEEVAWNEILTEREKTLSTDTSSFIIGPELMQLIQDEIAKKKAGDKTDGYDAIYRYLLKSGSPKDRFDFYQMYNLSPDAVADYLTKNYFIPGTQEK